MATPKHVVEALRQSPYPAMLIMYKFGMGSYSNCDPILKEALGLAPDLKRIGIYYDDCGVSVFTTSSYLLCLCTTNTALLRLPDF